MATTTSKLRATLARRFRQIAALVRRRGVRGLAARVLNVASQRLDRPTLLTGVRDEDVLAADLAQPWTSPSSAGAAADHLVINWVMAPPSEGSGGHTTAFRLIRYLQNRGHECRIYFYDVYGGDFEHYRSIVQRVFADASTEVASVFDGMRDADAVFATSWQSAYSVFNSRSLGKRFYLVQDLESSFYPAGSAATLAENTYKMGFHAVTAGRWLAQTLHDRFGMVTDSFDFGCDVDVYKLLDEPRRGVVFYARPEAARRAFEIGVMALQLFADRHPDIDLHFYGNKVGKMKMPIIDHGLVSPAELNVIYNRCFAGLSLSMTNVSLVPHEMLAAGCIPVVNDAVHNRVVLDNPFVRYAAPTPHALAACLSDVVTDPSFDQLARRAATSVRSASWDDAGLALETVLRREL